MKPSKEIVLGPTVTKSNQERQTMFYHKTLRNTDGTALRVRRNGQTKTWKTRPNDFRIPVTYALNRHSYIDQDNRTDWTIEEKGLF